MALLPKIIISVLLLLLNHNPIWHTNSKQKTDKRDSSDYDIL